MDEVHVLRIFCFPLELSMDVGFYDSHGNTGISGSLRYLFSRGQINLTTHVYNA